MIIMDSPKNDSSNPVRMTRNRCKNNNNLETKSLSPSTRASKRNTQNINDLNSKQRKKVKGAEEVTKENSSYVKDNKSTSEDDGLLNKKEPCKVKKNKKVNIKNSECDETFSGEVNPESPSDKSIGTLDNAVNESSVKDDHLTSSSSETLIDISTIVSADNSSRSQSFHNENNNDVGTLLNDLCEQIDNASNKFSYNTQKKQTENCLPEANNRKCQDSNLLSTSPKTYESTQQMGVLENNEQIISTDNSNKISNKIGGVQGNNENGFEIITNQKSVKGEKAVAENEPNHVIITSDGSSKDKKYKLSNTKESNSYLKPGEGLNTTCLDDVDMSLTKTDTFMEHLQSNSDISNCVTNSIKNIDIVIENTDAKLSQTSTQIDTSESNAFKEISSSDKADNVKCDFIDMSEDQDIVIAEKPALKEKDTSNLYENHVVSNEFLLKAHSVEYDVNALPDNVNSNNACDDNSFSEGGSLMIDVENTEEDPNPKEEILIDDNLKNNSENSINSDVSIHKTNYFCSDSSLNKKSSMDDIIIIEDAPNHDPDALLPENKSKNCIPNEEINYTDTAINISSENLSSNYPFMFNSGQSVNSFNSQGQSVNVFNSENYNDLFENQKLDNYSSNVEKEKKTVYCDEIIDLDNTDVSSHSTDEIDVVNDDKSLSASDDNVKENDLVTNFNSLINNHIKNDVIVIEDASFSEQKTFSEDMPKNDLQISNAEACETVNDKDSSDVKKEINSTNSCLVENQTKSCDKDSEIIEVVKTDVSINSFDEIDVVNEDPTISSNDKSKKDNPSSSNSKSTEKKRKKDVIVIEDSTQSKSGSLVNHCKSDILNEKTNEIARNISTKKLSLGNDSLLNDKGIVKSKSDSNSVKKEVRSKTDSKKHEVASKKTREKNEKGDRHTSIHSSKEKKQINESRTFSDDEKKEKENHISLVSDKEEEGEITNDEITPENKQLTVSESNQSSTSTALVPYSKKDDKSLKNDSKLEKKRERSKDEKVSKHKEKRKSKHRSDDKNKSHSDKKKRLHDEIDEKKHDQYGRKRFHSVSDESLVFTEEDPEEINLEDEYFDGEDEQIYTNFVFHPSLTEFEEDMISEEAERTIILHQVQFAEMNNDYILDALQEADDFVIKFSTSEKNIFSGNIKIKFIDPFTAKRYASSLKKQLYGIIVEHLDPLDKTKQKVDEIRNIFTVQTPFINDIKRMIAVTYLPENVTERDIKNEIHNALHIFFPKSFITKHKKRYAYILMPSYEDAEYILKENKSILIQENECPLTRVKKIQPSIDVIKEMDTLLKIPKEDLSAIQKDKMIFLHKQAQHYDQVDYLDDKTIKRLHHVMGRMENHWISYTEEGMNMFEVPEDYVCHNCCGNHWVRDCPVEPDYDQIKLNKSFIKRQEYRTNRCLNCGQKHEIAQCSIELDDERMEKNRLAFVKAYICPNCLEEHPLAQCMKPFDSQRMLRYERMIAIGVGARKPNNSLIKRNKKDALPKREHNLTDNKSDSFKMHNSTSSHSSHEVIHVFQQSTEMSKGIGSSINNASGMAALKSNLLMQNSYVSSSSHYVSFNRNASFSTQDIINAASNISKSDNNLKPHEVSDGENRWRKSSKRSPSPFSPESHKKTRRSLTKSPPLPHSSKYKRSSRSRSNSPDDYSNAKRQSYHSRHKKSPSPHFKGSVSPQTRRRKQKPTYQKSAKNKKKSRNRSFSSSSSCSTSDSSNNSSSSRSPSPPPKMKKEVKTEATSDIEIVSTTPPLPTFLPYQSNMNLNPLPPRDDYGLSFMQWRLYIIDKSYVTKIPHNKYKKNPLDPRLISDIYMDFGSNIGNFNSIFNPEVIKSEPSEKMNSDASILFNLVANTANKNNSNYFKQSENTSNIADANEFNQKNNFQEKNTGMELPNELLHQPPIPPSYSPEKHPTSCPPTNNISSLLNSISTLMLQKKALINQSSVTANNNSPNYENFAPQCMTVNSPINNNSPKSHFFNASFSPNHQSLVNNNQSIISVDEKTMPCQQKPNSLVIEQNFTPLSLKNPVQKRVDPRLERRALKQTHIKKEDSL